VPAKSDLRQLEISELLCDGLDDWMRG